uniref:Ig-like domain-containing protein n=1 Tax=uncultured Draconibacterium sp. TaxID=1573823 RepID=UPI003216531F
MRKLMYIVFFLMMAANLFAQEIYVVDSVCIGAERTYRHDGEEGYSYYWEIIDVLNRDTSNVPGVDFMEVDNIDTTWGNEITKLWDLVGDFDILVQVTTEHGCDTVEQGMVRVFPLPEAHAGDDEVLCNLEDIIVYGDSAWNYSVIYWGTTGDGILNNEYSLHPTYSFGPNDSLLGEVTLFLTAEGLADNGTCQPAVDSVTYLISKPEFEFGMRELLCYNDHDAIIWVSMTGGAAPFDFAWTGPDDYSASGNDRISGLGAGMYYLTVTDANGCMAMDSLEIVNPPELTALSEVVQQISCYGYYDGIIRASASGGTGNLFFQWNSQLGSVFYGDSIVGLPADTYYLTVTDENGCTYMDTVVLPDPELLLVDVTADDIILCEGEMVILHGNPVGGTGMLTHSWTGNGSVFLNSTTDSVSSFQGAPVGNYRLTYRIIDQALCEASDSIELNVYPPSYSYDSMEVCAGADPFAWNGKTITSDMDRTYQDTLPGMNQYGCDSILTLDVKVLFPVDFDTTIYVCENEVPFALYNHTILPDRDSIYLDTAYYSYSGCDSLHVTIHVFTLPVTDTMLEMALCAGADEFQLNNRWVQTDFSQVYFDTLYNANQFGCDSLLTYDVTIIPPDTFRVDTTLCQDEPEFVWNGVMIETVYDSIYEATLSNRFGCDSLVQLDVHLYPATDTLMDTLLCYGNQPYTWNSLLIYSEHDSIYRDTLQNIYGCDSIVNLDVKVLQPYDSLQTVELCANQLPYSWNSHTVLPDRDSIYYDTIYYDAGCDSLRLQLEVIALPVSDTLIDTVLCEGSPEFVWNSHTVSTYVDSTYRDTLTNVWGCDSTLILNVQVVPAFKDTIPEAICYGEPVADWYGQTISFEKDSIYIHNIPDPSGCDTLLYYEVTVLPVTEVELDTTLCYGLPEFKWNNRLISTTADAIYLDTLINSYGCDSLLTYNVTILPPDTVRMDTILCVGDPEYDWNGYTVSTTVEDVYEATLQTALDCDSVVILTTTLINGITTHDTVYACEEYFWEAKGKTYTESGIYMNTLGSGTACPDTTWLHLVISNPVIVLNPVHVLCYGDSTGSIDLTVSGGIAPYTFLWSNGEITEDISNLIAGTYGVVVADSLNCTDSIMIEIVQPDSFYISDVIIDSAESSTDVGSIFIEVEGGTPEYSFAWNTGDTTQNLENQPPGTYTIVVTDANGCPVTRVVSLPAREAGDRLRVVLDPTPVLCYGEYNGKIDLDVSGGSGNYLFDWVGPDDFSSVLEDITGLQAGLYTVTVTDIEDSTLVAIRNTIVEEPDPIEVSYLKTDVGNSPNPIGSIDLTIEGGTGPYDILWIFPDGSTSTSEDLTGLEIGNYRAEITDANGCPASVQVQITGYGIICPDPVSLCPDEKIPAAFTTVEAFRNGGGSISSTPPIIESSFTSSDVSDGNRCPEIIIRTYSVENTKGDVMSCEQMIIREDDIKPTISFVTQYIDACSDYSPRKYRNTKELLIYAGNYVTLDDNCTPDNELVLEEVRPEQIVQMKCPKIVKRFYRVYDGCRNPSDVAEAIFVIESYSPMKLVRGIPDLADVGCVIPPPLTSYSEFVALGGSVVNACSPALKWISDSKPDENGVVLRTYRIVDECSFVPFVQKIYTETYLPEFDPMGPLCQFSLAPGLPTTSINGFTGTWSPATISTDVPGTMLYSFTPDPGQCAGPGSIEIEVRPAIQVYETLHVDQGYSALPVGEIEVGVTNGTEPFEYLWDMGKTTNYINKLLAGSYTVFVSDSIGCLDTLTVELIALVPEFSCPPDTVIECPDVAQYPAANNITDFIAMGGHYYPVDIVTDLYGVDDTIASEYCLSIERTYVVRDIYGRVDSCTQTIDFYDIVPPVLVAPESETEECLSTVVPGINSYADFLVLGGDAYDVNCTLDTTSFTAVKRPPVRLSDRTEVTYVFSIQDICGNIAYDSTTYISTDIEPPVAICNSITVYLDENGHYVLSEIDMETISEGSNDNCTAPEDLIIEIEAVEFTCEDVEEGKQVSVVVTDEAGNSGNCMALINVADTIPPTALCKDVTVYLDETGQATVTGDMIDNGSFDNCKLDSVIAQPAQYDCYDVGENPVQLIAVDAYGLRDTCEAIVTVIDLVDPAIVCKEKQTIQLDEYGKYSLTWDMVTDSVWDECGIDTVLLDDYELDCDNIGTTFITATAYDVNGNSSMCQAEFEIYGNIPPNVVNDSAVTNMDIPIDIPVTDNDYDLKTDINLGSLGVLIKPMHGSVVVDNSTGIVNYTPDPGYVGPDVFKYKICDDAIPCEEECGEAIVFITVRPANQPPIAVDDYFEVPCGDLNGNIILNDSDPDGNTIEVNPIPVTPPDSGLLSLSPNGYFEYIPFEGFFGIDSFQYVICDDGIPSLCDTAWVYITRVADNDCDGIADVDDIDDDNDGIRDVNEGDLAYDSDLDGIPDSYDVDSDNDGIPDNIEGQDEHNYIPPTGRDTDGDGWDDAYDPDNGGYPFDIDLTDTDGDSMPDFLDIDSDNDGVFDFIEGHDENADGIADVIRIYSDSDFDGLDDAYDTQEGWALPGNETGSNAPLQDFDDDGDRDWRDTNDEDDAYMTVNEDINGNGDYSDDDLDLDGHPEYLDTEIDCELFIPEGFSPNDDGVHDFFQILCIYPRYPNAKMMIFNRNGQKLFEKENYGNYDVWGWDDAWWWGTSENALTIGKSGGLPAGNYIYVLILNDGLGTVKNGTVMLAY